MIVHVVISVGERMQRGRDPTQPLSGGPMSIFAPQATTVVSVIEAIGAYTDLRVAHAAAGTHLAKHPSDRVKIKVVTVDAVAEDPKPQDLVCIYLEVMPA